MKMASTSTTVIYRVWKPLTNFLYRGKKSDSRLFSFRLDIGIRNFSHVYELVAISKLKKGRINLGITNL